MTAAVGFKRIVITILGVVSAGVLALASATWIVSPETARDAVTSEVRAVTGLEPRVAGATVLSMFPSPRITLGAVSLGRATSDARPFVAEELVANLRWLPLLTGRIEIADVELVRPRIAIAYDAQGRSNWGPLLDGLATRLRAGSAVDQLSFTEIRIVDGAIIVEDTAHALVEELDGVSLSLAWPSISRTFAATGRVRWRDQPLDVGVVVADFPAALSGDTSGLKLRVSGQPVKLAFEGALSHRPSLKVDGTLSADAPSLRRAMSWIAGKPLPGAGLGRFALKARTNLVGGALALSNLNLELDGNTAEGVLTYSVRDRQFLQGTLAVEALDLTPYAAAMRLLAADSRDWDRRPLALDWADGFDFDLRVSAARVLTPQTRLGRTAAAATLRDGRLAITIGEAQAFNGVVTGSFSIAKAGAGAQVRSQLLFADVDLDTCLADLIGVRRVDGKGTLAVALDGAGDSVHAVTRTLAGSIRLTGNRGHLSGVDLEQLLRRLERRPLAGASDFRSGRTAFDQFAVALKVAKGVATIEEMRFDGGNVRLAVGGTASVPGRDLDLSGTASLLAAAAEAPPTFELPFFVQGTWDDPIMLPDTQALIRRSGAAAPLLDAVNDPRARDAVRSAIDRLGRGEGAAVLRRLGVPVPGAETPPAGAAAEAEAPAAALPSR